MKRLGGLRCLAALWFGMVAFDGCSGHESPPMLPVSADSSIVQNPRTVDASVVAAEPLSDGTALTAEDQPIAGAAPPDVAGTYAGTIQDRTPQVSVERGTIRLALDQRGAAVSGSIDIVNDQGGTASYTFAGTSAATTKGAILHLSIADPTGRTVGVWAKVIGWTMFGKGWADSDATTHQPYEQLLFTMHRTATAVPTSTPTASPAPSSNPIASPHPIGT